MPVYNSLHVIAPDRVDEIPILAQSLFGCSPELLTQTAVLPTSRAPPLVGGQLAQLLHGRLGLDNRAPQADTCHLLACQGESHPIPFLILIQTLEYVSNDLGWKGFELALGLLVSAVLDRDLFT